MKSENNERSTRPKMVKKVYKIKVDSKFESKTAEKQLDKAVRCQFQVPCPCPSQNHVQWLIWCRA